MRQLKIDKLNIDKLFKNSPRNIKKMVTIDIIFYIFITVGFFGISYISLKFKIEPYTASIIWTCLFIPILILKVRKDILK